MTAETPLYLTRAQSRAVDEIAISEFGMLGLVLMENAGRNAAEIISEAILDRQETRNWPIVICCGKGNNGGDGFVIARHLANAELAPIVLLWAQPNELTGDAAANYFILEKMQAKIICIGAETWGTALAAAPLGKVILIDALLGTGATGAPREPYSKAIAWINSLNGLVFAIDLPSGLDAETGLPSQFTISADYTLTFATSKAGFRNEAAKPYLGVVRVVDIGVPRSVIEMAAKR